MNLAADVIANEGIKNQQQAIDRNKSVARQVRQAVINSKGRLPERLPLEAEPIKIVRKRVAASEKKWDLYTCLTHGAIPARCADGERVALH